MLVSFFSIILITGNSPSPIVKSVHTAMSIGSSDKTRPGFAHPIRQDCLQTSNYSMSKTSVLAQ
jgi:hypothetical protein